MKNVWMLVYVCSLNLCHSLYVQPLFKVKKYISYLMALFVWRIYFYAKMMKKIKCKKKQRYEATAPPNTYKLEKSYDKCHFEKADKIISSYPHVLNVIHSMCLCMSVLTF